VKLDIVDGDTARETRFGWEFDRIAKVYGLTGTGSARAYTAASVSGMPSLGDEHPSVPYCYLNEKQITSVTSDCVTIRLPYAQRSLYTTKTIFGGNLVQEETNLDRLGDLMTVGYTYPATYPYNPNLAGTVAEDQSNLVPILRSRPTIVYSQTETSSPLDKKKWYEGKVNSGPWSLDPSAVSGQWLCTGINGVQEHDLADYEVTYSFAYKEGTWVTTALWIDGHTGRPPPDLVVGTGIVDYECYELADFNLILL
jgi:hypothetical protein